MKTIADFFVHLRLPFQLALAPFFMLGLVDATRDGGLGYGSVALAFVAVHVGLYGGTTVFNSFYDRDVGPIGMVRRPKPVLRWHRDASVVLQAAAVALLVAIDWRAGLVAFLMALLGVAYSHPRTRLKGKTTAGLATVALGQGALAVFLGRFVGASSSPDATTWVVAGAASLVALGLYPLTQVYQIDEDSGRGDVTFPVRFGWRATFVFSGVTTVLALPLLLASIDTVPAVARPWLGAASGLCLVIYLWRWARRFEALGTFGNHDRAMALAVSVAAPLTALLFVSLLVWPSGAARAEDAVEVSFEFQDPKTGEVILGGKETVKHEGRATVKHTEYRTLEGKVLQTEDCRYDEQSLALETYAFADSATGERAGVRVTDGKADASYKKDKDSDEKTNDFPWTATSLSGKAIPDLIGRHFAKVRNGEAVEFDLYIPFRLETLGFRAVKDAERSTESRLVVRAEPRNWLIRQLAPAIAFTYELDAKGGEPRLSQYDGPSMVDIQGEKNRKVRILFH